MKTLKQTVSLILLLAFGVSAVFNILFLFGKTEKTLIYAGVAIIVVVAFLVSLLGYIMKSVRKEQYVAINILTPAKEFGGLYAGMIIIWVATYFVSFIFGSAAVIYTNDGFKLLPEKCEACDLDFDGIPEIIMDFDEGVMGRGVYKLYDTDYELIGILDGGIRVLDNEDNYERLYVNPDNKIVSVKRNSTQIFEIVNKQIVYSEYIDSTGSDSYNGIKYADIGSASEFFTFASYEEYINCEVFLADLRRIPQLEYSDALNALKLAKNKKSTAD